jgi:rare lipoprotein A
MTTSISNYIHLLIICLLTALIFSGCAGQQKARQYDSAQKTPPKATQKPYTVNGKRYEPLASAHGFEQEGIASSYGRDFHGRKTSSGEPFDMHAMTAAHKTLPLGVYVKVRHRKTDREVIVRINDRGPFVRDRIIDLSEGAAVRLGMLQEGLAPVKVTALGYKSESISGNTVFKQPDNYDIGNYTLQVGAFTVKENAYRYAADLRRKYGTADVQEATVTGTKYYRVRMGRYTSLKAAQTALEKYWKTGFAGSFTVAVD